MITKKKYTKPVSASESQLKEVYMGLYAKYSKIGIPIAHPETVGIFGGKRKYSGKRGRQWGSKNKIKSVQL